MTDATLLTVTDLSKSYFLSHGEGAEERYALRNVSITLNKGDSIGLIGRNGSGKSTLLKVVSGLVRPTSGSVIVNGKVNALIEVGSNFIPDLTGRENVVHYLRFNEIPESEIWATVEEVFRFSELGSYFDSPVKQYSSGMFVRLAASAGLFVKADIYVLDEVLMAGDMEFRLKLTERFKDFQRAKSAGFLIASHSPQEIMDYCTESVWLENGDIKMRGGTSAVIGHYYEFLHEVRRGREEQNSSVPVLSVDDVAVLDESQRSNGLVAVTGLRTMPKGQSMLREEPFEVVIEFENRGTFQPVFPMVQVYDVYLRPILIVASSNDEKVFESLGRSRSIGSSTRLTCTIPAFILSAGTYYLELLIGGDPTTEEQTEEVYRLPKKLRFQVHSHGVDHVGQTHSVFVRPKCKWSVEVNDVQ